MGAILDARDANVKRDLAMKVLLDSTKANREQVLHPVQEAQTKASCRTTRPKDTEFGNSFPAFSLLPVAFLGMGSRVSWLVGAIVCCGVILYIYFLRVTGEIDTLEILWHKMRFRLHLGRENALRNLMRIRFGSDVNYAFEKLPEFHPGEPQYDAFSSRAIPLSYSILEKEEATGMIENEYGGNPYVYYSIELLGAAGPAAKKAGPILLRLLGDGDCMYPSKALLALDCIEYIPRQEDNPVRILEPFLTSDDQFQRMYAYNILARAGLLTEEARYARYALELGKAKEFKAEEAIDAISFMMEVRADRPEGVELVKSVITDENSDVRNAAFEVLDRVGELTDELKLQKYDVDFRQRAAYYNYGYADNNGFEGCMPVFQKIEALGIVALPVLFGFLGHHSLINTNDFEGKRLQRVIANAVIRMAPLVDDPLEYLVDLKRCGLLTRLGSGGGVLRRVEPELLDRLRSSDDYRDFDRFSQIAGDIEKRRKAVHIVLSKLSHPDSSVRFYAASVLREIGQFDDRVVRALRAVITEDTNETNRTQAQYILVQAERLKEGTGGPTSAMH